MYNLIQQPDDWSETFSHQFITAWMSDRELILREFKWVTNCRRMRDVKITSYDILRNVSTSMPRKGRQSNDAKRDTSSRFGGEKDRNELKWLNIKLEDNDLDALEQSDSTFEYLSACATGLASDGYGISIKPVDEGKSFCFTIIGSNPGTDGVSYGLSSFAGTVRDVLLVGMYKFDQIMGGDFADADKFTVSTKQAVRFR